MKNQHIIKNVFLTILFTFLFTTFISFSTYAFGPSSNQIYQGIDVSNWQGNINFSAVRNSGIEVVYIKSSEGQSYIDPYFETNYNNAKANGLRVGFYHYVTATNTEEAQAQADFFARVVSRKTGRLQISNGF